MSERREAGELIGNFLSLAPAAFVLDDVDLVDELSHVRLNRGWRIGSRPGAVAIAAGTHLMDERGLDILNGLPGTTTQRRSGSGRSTTTAATQLIRAAVRRRRGGVLRSNATS